MKNKRSMRKAALLMQTQLKYLNKNTQKELDAWSADKILDEKLSLYNRIENMK